MTKKKMFMILCIALAAGLWIGLLINIGEYFAAFFSGGLVVLGAIPKRYVRSKQTPQQVKSKLLKDASRYL